jgi:hypothetical protein
MLKLYKKTGNEFLYWETWEKDTKTGIIHWGKVGERGTQRQVFSGIFSGYQKIVQKEINKQAAQGYKPIHTADYHKLYIEYKIDGQGTTEDLEKRDRLEHKMNQTLGWTGLGHCDGGSTGSETMEVCCLVVDFEIAKQVIEADLKDTEFDDYIRIFNEE